LTCSCYLQVYQFISIMSILFPSFFRFKLIDLNIKKKDQEK